MMRIQKAELLVGFLSFLDGVQAIVLVTLLPFLLFVNSAPSSNSLVLASPLGIGFLFSVAGTFLIGYIADLVNPIKVLLLSQILQFFILITLLIWALQGQSMQTAFGATLVLIFSRSFGPAKDKVRAIVILPERRRSINSTIRRYFLIINHLTALSCTLALSTLAVSKWPLLLIIAICAVIGSFIIVLFLKPIYLAGNQLSFEKSQTTNRFQIAPILIMLLIPIGLSLNAGIPSVGFSAWLAATHFYQPWIAGVVGTILVAFDFVFLKIITRFIDTGQLKMSWLHRIGGILLITSCCLINAALYFPTGFNQLLVLSLAFVCVTFCTSISSLIALEIQYGFGQEQTRGRIASLTRISVTIGYAVTTWISPSIYFQNLFVFMLLLFAGIFLVFIPSRYCLYLHNTIVD